MDPNEQLIVSEVFGPTFQGEGPSVGHRAGFVRLGRCNLTCEWCFVPETPVLMADWSLRPLGSLSVGSQVIAAKREPSKGAHMRLTIATVTATARREAPTVVVNGSIRCTP